MFEINYIFILVGALFALLLLMNDSKLSDAGDAPDIKISVIIPARNECHNISNLLNDLKKQTYVPHEVICVDDGSDDGTGDIAKGHGAKLIEAGELPDGWRGKPWACQQGALHSEGDVLLFLDADVRLHEQALKVLATNYTNGTSCISVQPYHKTKKIYEQFSLLFNLIQVMAMGIGLPLSIKKKGLFGPVFMISKKTFEETGGYFPVKGEVVEDYCLGKYYSKHNISPKLFLGKGYISYRMYPLGFLSLAEGWSKNFSTGALKTRLWILFMIVVYITGMGAAFKELLEKLTGGEYILAAVMALAYLFFAVHLWLSARKIGTFSLASCLLYPFILAFFFIIFLFSAVATYLLKCTTWKGRRL